MSWQKIARLCLPTEAFGGTTSIDSAAMALGPDLFGQNLCRRAKGSRFAKYLHKAV